jgi:carboxyl-terminal processing protease
VKHFLLALAVALVVLSVTPRATAEQKFDVTLAGRVFGAALEFTAPRALEAVTPATLTLWGLGGISALDPALTAAQSGTAVTLLQGGRTVVTLRAPAPDDAAAWGRLAAQLNGAAFAASQAMREAGGQAAIQSFFEEMFGHLDPYSRYVPPAPAEIVRDKLSVDAAAGLTLVRERSHLVVAAVAPAGPAAEAGVRVGDRLVSVDGRTVRRRSPSAAQEMLTGQEGEERVLLVRGLDGVARSVPLTLAYVPPESVFSSRDGDLLVLRVSTFDGNTAERLSQEIEAGMAVQPAPAAMIVDLRGNRGGLLRQAVTSVALFAEHGVIASTAGRDPQATHDWRIDDGGDLTHGRSLIVLVDGRTASAAEIMAAALADLGRAVVVGSSTFGKGLVQTLTTLPDGGELYVSWSRVLAPRMWPLQSLGVMPQVCTSRSDDDVKHQLADLMDGHNDMAQAVMNERNARPPLSAGEALSLRRPCPVATGTDADVLAARFLAHRPKAYETALIR